LLAIEGVRYTQVQKSRDVDSVLQQIGPVDVVFLDLEMPEFNGYEVLQRLRADARFQNVPVVACTVHISEINTTQEMGFDGFLGKPLDADRFPQQLQRILSGESVWESV
jgi:two-component system cell cycle response regulator DivK